MSSKSLRKPPNRALSYGNYAQSTAKLYDGIAEWYVRSFWNDETDSDWIRLCLSATEGTRTLIDIGSGPGNYARFFVEAGREVTCTDISREMIREAKAKLPTILGVVSDMRQMPFGDTSFDCVFCAYSLNHVLEKDLEVTLREFGRMLRPKGVLCLMLKTGSHSYEFSDAGNPSSRGVMCLYSQEEMLEAIRQVGVEPTLVRFKSETSEREFQHEKMLVVGSKGPIDRA